MSQAGGRRCETYYDHAGFSGLIHPDERQQGPADVSKV